MKLNFATQKTISLNPEIILNKIEIYLKENDYKLIEKTDTTIIFNDDVIERLKPAYRSEYYTRVNSGKFEFITKGAVVTLKLSYNTSIVMEFIFLSVILFTGIYVDHRVLVIYILFVLNFACKIYYINTNLLNDIVDE